MISKPVSLEPAEGFKASRKIVMPYSRAKFLGEVHGTILILPVDGKACTACKNLLGVISPFCRVVVCGSDDSGVNH